MPIYLRFRAKELEFIPVTKNAEEVSRLITDKCIIPVILVTLGPSGCFYRKRGIQRAFTSL